MNWSTIYITGRRDFREEVRNKIEASGINCMPGYTGGSTGFDVHDLYWIDEKTSSRELKEAIGSKLVWKYRLHFYNSLEEFIESQNLAQGSTEFTAEDLALIAEMQAAFSTKKVA
ncbi:MAG: hypothetical protein ACOYXT_28010 [Bacteroidota bacterium]